jgi:hypothetical protein
MLALHFRFYFLTEDAIMPVNQLLHKRPAPGAISAL